MMHWGWGDYGMGGGSWLFMILFWVLIILGLVYLVKMLASGGGKSSSRETAEDILKKRFASGEISKEEFEKAMQVLKQHE